MTAMQPPDQIRALDAAMKFVRTQMQPADLMAILRYSGGSVDVLQDFTDDRDRLLSIIETLIVGEGQDWTRATRTRVLPISAPRLVRTIANSTSLIPTGNYPRCRPQPDVGATQREKSLIYFASGLRLNGINNQAQLHATINAAIRAGVSFWPIDARGLVAEAPLGDATQGSPGGIGMYSGASALSLTTNFQQSQDTLYALAGDTGGKALLDYNDLTKGIVQAEQAVRATTSSAITRPIRLSTANFAASKSR